MANTDAPFGFRPVMHKGGAPYNGAANLYLATCGTSLFIGDPVLITGQSNSAELNGMPPGSVPIVNVVGTTDVSPISGVIVGVVPTDATSTTYYAGTKTATQVWVCDDPDMLFEVQCDGTITQEEVGNAAVMVTTHAGSTTTGRSGSEISATLATQGVYVLERLAPRADNDLASANAKCWVSVRKHTRSHSGGRGIAGLGVGIA